MRARIFAVVIAMLVLAVPAVAVAEMNHNGEEITNETTVKETGTLDIGGGVSCPAEAFKIIKPGGKVTVEKFRVENKKGETDKYEDCTTNGTLKALGCTGVTGLTANGLEWAVDNSGTALTVTGFDVQLSFAGGVFCPKSVSFSGDVTATPDDVESIHSFEWSGTLSSSLGTNVSISAFMEVTGEDSGTYGL